MDDIRAHLAAASTAPMDLALVHLARARCLLVALEADAAEARRALEALEREQVRKAAIDRSVDGAR